MQLLILEIVAFHSPGRPPGRRHCLQTQTRGRVVCLCTCLQEYFGYGNFATLYNDQQIPNVVSHCIRKFTADFREFTAADLHSQIGDKYGNILF